MTLSRDQSRRSFVVLTGTGLVALLSGCSKPGENGDSGASGTSAGGTTGGTSTTGGTTTGGTTTGGTTTGGQTTTSSTTTATDCAETPPNIQGPFWREGVPIRSDLDLYDDDGISLTISGKVTDLDCVPLENAIVEVWHAYPSTVAVEDLQDSDTVGYDQTTSEMEYRGQMATDSNGRYSFHTLKPGWYLNAGVFRPCHIHIKVWVDGVDRLTTQLYFEGDPLIEGDPYAKKALEVALTEDANGALSGSFNFAVDLS